MRATPREVDPNQFRPEPAREATALQDLFQYAGGLSENQILLVLVAFILALLGYALVKRLLKLALFVAVFLVIYSGLVYYLG